MNYLMDYVVRSNDEERSPLEFASREEADGVCAKLNAETDSDTKFWVASKGYQGEKEVSMPKAFVKQPVPHYVAMAWELIQLLGLNGKVPLGDKLVMRFHLVDAKGIVKDTPAEAEGIFDIHIGKTFMPQTDADWLDQLMTRFRVGTQWRENLGAWEARVTPDGVGHGQTPGIAVVEALVTTCRAGTQPIKHTYPGDQ